MNIYTLLPKVAADVGAIGKERRNHGQGYNYRGIEDVMNVCHPALVKHGVTVIPIVLEHFREERVSKSGGANIFTVLKTQYQFFAPDGSMVSAIVMSEGMDSGDKSINKALSAGFKYALGQVLSIPFELIDSEDDSHDRPADRQNSVQPEANKTEAPRQVEKAKEPAPANAQATRAKQMAEIARMAQELGHDKKEMLAQIGRICGLPKPPTSGKDLDDEQIANAYTGYRFMVALAKGEGNANNK